MSSISGVGARHAWPESSTSTSGSSRADRMFAKIDSDGSGSVDATELQGMLDHLSSQTGDSLGSSADLMTTFDSDGNGSLSQSELGDGMKSLMPAPSSTVDFAQQKMGGMPPPPPPDDASGSSSSTSTDPLDTNGDGTVSAEEKAAGQLADALSELFSAVDSDGDGKISKTEADSFKSTVDSAIDSLQSASSSSSNSTTDSSSSNGASQGSDGSSSRFDLTAFVNLVLKEYGQAAAATSTATGASSLSLTA